MLLLDLRDERDIADDAIIRQASATIFPSGHNILKYMGKSLSAIINNAHDPMPLWGGTLFTPLYVTPYISTHTMQIFRISSPSSPPPQRYTPTPRHSYKPGPSLPRSHPACTSHAPPTSSPAQSPTSSHHLSGSDAYTSLSAFCQSRER